MQSAVVCNQSSMSAPAICPVEKNFENLENVSCDRLRARKRQTNAT